MKFLSLINLIIGKDVFFKFSKNRIPFLVWEYVVYFLIDCYEITWIFDLNFPKTPLSEFDSRVQVRKNWKSTFSRSTPTVGLLRTCRTTCRLALYLRSTVQYTNYVYRLSWTDVDYSKYQVAVITTIFASIVPVTGVIVFMLGNFRILFDLSNIVHNTFSV